jgi:hypothetical protein
MILNPIDPQRFLLRSRERDRGHVPILYWCSFDCQKMKTTMFGALGSILNVAAGPEYILSLRILQSTYATNCGENSVLIVYRWRYPGR